MKLVIGAATKLSATLVINLLWSYHVRNRLYGDCQCKKQQHSSSAHQQSRQRVKAIAGLATLQFLVQFFSWCNCWCSFGAILMQFYGANYKQTVKKFNPVNSLKSLGVGYGEVQKLQILSRAMCRFLLQGLLWLLHTCMLGSSLCPNKGDAPVPWSITLLCTVLGWNSSKNWKE